VHIYPPPESAPPEAASPTSPPTATASSSADRSARPALLLELPARAAADKFWNKEPFAKNGGYQRERKQRRERNRTAGRYNPVL